MKKMKIEKILWLGIWILFLYCMGLIFSRSFPKTHFTLAVTNTVYAQKAEYFERIESLRHYEDPIQVLNSVARGQADVGLTDQLIALHLIHLKPEFRNLRLTGDLLEKEAVGVAFNLRDDSLRQAINRGLAEIAANGIYESISMRYFGRNIQPKSMVSAYPEQTPADDGAWKKIRLADEFRFAMSGDNPPFSYLDENQQLAGFDVDLAREVCIQLGIQNFTPVLVKRGDLLQGLINRRYDAIWNSMKITETDRALVVFSKPYYETGAQLIVRKKSPITGPETFSLSVFQEKFQPPIFAKKK
ncbi:MAG: transporter substrate-binding domain-containing protein [Firmicutes bacterium]|nr:transporter substrate-binding domain-containing protein [Bacillota bacterium]